ncbi:PREDICTED: uncharacterized protein LOC18603951 [Theobroma cacao]|uniref:Uncharacterized protein LOC18603951 n=1 Tax=Theobroma cacao TaxID=3641 RepID=A0AB32W0W2_THECC|nr:PREDICTED: uncharacterized protein LOC18603951 [Theobroma cacao]
MEAHNVCSSAIVAQVLTGEDNYENWRACIKNYLWVRDLWDVVEQTSEPSQQEDEAEFMAWSKRNVSALHAIQISCDPIMLSHIRNMTSAKDAWNTLAQVCQLPMPQDAPQITEDAPQITEDAPQIIEDAPQIVEDAPQITEDAPQIVEDAPQITEDAPQITEDAPQITEDAPQITEDAPQITEDAPQITEDAPQITEDAAQIPAVGDVERTRILAFLEAVKRCDLEATKNLLNAHPHFANTEIPGSGQTTLHFAIFEGQLEMINGLLNTMSNQYLKKRDFYGRTALHYVAMSSENAKVAQSLIRKEKQLLTTPDNGGEIPLNYACWIGHKDMTHYLYNMTPREFLLSQGNECYSAGLVVECIRYKWFDVVWHLLRDHPNLAFAETKNGLNAVSILSSQPSAFPSGNRLSFWQRWIYSCQYHFSLLLLH